MKKILWIILGITLFFIAQIFVLPNTFETYQHNILTYGNTVYISEDGHQEIVIDQWGKSVIDDVNMGNYNYYHPQNKPLLHFLYDTVPWIKWGNSANDTSTFSMRLTAFVKDYGHGYIYTMREYMIPIVGGILFIIGIKIFFIFKNKRNISKLL